MGVPGVPDIRESGQIRECQWPAASPGQYLAYPKCSFFVNSACWAMPAGSRSAAQSAGGRKKGEIWDLVKKRRKGDHERRQGDEQEALGVQIL